MIEASSNDQIFSILFNNDEITWQSMIYELVSSERMDPWDIDVSLLAQKFLDRLRKLKEMDLKISGKVLLAAAIMLRVKSYRFVEEDINALDSLIASIEDPSEDLLMDELVEYEPGTEDLSAKPEIYPRTPQPRKRKVSVFDLVKALEKALDVFKRRPPKVKSHPEVKLPERTLDIGRAIKDVYRRILDLNGKSASKLTFTNLLPEDSKHDKVFTFIPLLHLDHQRKVELIQKIHFGEIEVELLKIEEL